MDAFGCCTRVFSCVSVTFLADRIWHIWRETAKPFILICELSCQVITDASHALNGSSLLRLCRLVRLVRIIKALPSRRLRTNFDLESSCSNGLAKMSTHMYLFLSLSIGTLINVAVRWSWKISLMGTVGVVFLLLGFPPEVYGRATADGVLTLGWKWKLRPFPYSVVH